MTETVPRPGAADFRCAAASLERHEPIVGTASTVRPWLLVENPGPWGIDALRDNRMPPGVKDELARTAEAAGVRVVLVRRHHRRAPRHGFRVFAAWADATDPWMEEAVLDDPEDLLDLDLGALARGRSVRLAPHYGHVWGACTHGKHDACCAERGRPVAAALAEVSPEQAWECSHIGGDRFAANAVVLPHGWYFGRLDAATAREAALALDRGELVLDHLRGRAGLPMPVQAAEIAVRRRLGETRVAGVRTLGHRRDGEVTDARFEVDGMAYDVTVRTRPGDYRGQLTCRATRPGRPPVHEVIDISEAPNPGGSP